MNVRFFSFKKSIIISALFLSIIISQSAHAQYKLYWWTNFEDQKLPNGYVPYGQNFKDFIRISELNTAARIIPHIRDEQFIKETGQYSLCLISNPKVIKEAVEYAVGLGVGVILDREKLGESGKALYQADFFMPAPPEALPNLAVLATEPTPPGSLWPSAMYRFGITKNTQGKSLVYFSRVDTSAAGAKVFKQDPDLVNKLPRPGWHRFAIIFEGQSKIRCYIDGHEPSFSPFNEPDLKKLHVGIMLADKGYTYTCYVDNLSIQWTAEDVPLPDSPYASSWNAQAATPSTGSPMFFQDYMKDNKLKVDLGNLAWVEPEEVWGKAAQTNKPALVYFYAPKVANTLNLNQIIETNSAAKSELSKYILTKIDVNQLQGNVYAEKYGIFKVPTIIMFSPQGAELKRALFLKTDTWDTFAAKLFK